MDGVLADFAAAFEEVTTFEEPPISFEEPSLAVER